LCEIFSARESRELTRILGEISCCQSFAKWRIEFFAPYSRLFACFAGAILLNPRVIRGLLRLNFSFLDEFRAACEP